MRHKSKNRLLTLLLIALVVLGVYLYMRPIPPAQPVSEIISPPKTQAITLPWPATGQAALGAVGYGVLETHNTSPPVSVASIAKIITALAILEKKPLSAGNQGPILTLDNTDLDYYNYYYTNNGSIAKVSPGEQISEYQALQALLLPSANNIADSMVRWAFGSPANYVSYANKMLKDSGINRTTVGDASGFNDSTTSTADDLVKIGIKAVQNPAIADVVSQQTATVPVAGEIKNVNWLLGSDGVIGIKTGNTDKAGGCYLFAAKRQILGKQITEVGAVLGVPQLNDAISSAVSLLRTADSGFQQVTVVPKNQVLGYYKTPWGKTAQLKPAKDLSLLVWKGKDIKIVGSLEPVNAPVHAGASAGSLSVVSGGQTVSSRLSLARDLPGPTWYWRLFR